jgi:hypothetical protein
MHEVPSCFKQKVIPMPQKIPARGGESTPSGSDSAGSNHFRRFPAQRPRRFAFGLFLLAVARVKSSRWRTNLPAR